MASNFIPSFHLIPSEQKLNPDWCKKAIDYYWHHSNVKSLLSGKDIDEIERYSSGNIDMKKYLSLFKSLKKKYIERATKRQLDFLSQEPDIDSLVFQPLPLIQSKLNSAISLIQKIPIEVSCVANDALAMKKRKEDIDFLKNKPIIEADLQDIADQLQMPKYDIGGTKHSDIEYGENPLGMDLQDPEQEKMFTNMVYALKVETALEKVLQQFADFKDLKQIRLLETKDQYKYAVSCNNVFISEVTGLNDISYVHPNDIYVAESFLPDFSDREARFWENRLTISEVFNRFSSEIGTIDDLDTLVGSYCHANKMTTVINENNYDTAKVSLVYCEIKSVDSVGVFSNSKSKRGFSMLTADEKASDRIWGQNTYCFWWLKNTQYFFGIDKLDYAHRTNGMESYQNFSINIYKSAEKSAVELAIPENKKAQVADIKLNFAVVMAKADGVYIDLRGIRNAASGMKDKDASTEKELINLAIERNIIIADTEGFEGKNDGQFKPVIPIAGGIGNVNGYLSVIEAADRKINQFIGTNDSLTGMSANPDALIGVEKLRINASVNALYYVTEAIETQLKKVFYTWGNNIQKIIKDGGKPKKTLVDYIGAEGVGIIEGLEQVPLHHLSIRVGLGQREEERQNYLQKLNLLIQRGAITLTEEFMLSSISNPKQRFAMLAVVEKRWKAEQEKNQQAQYQNASALKEQEMQGELALINAEAEGDIKKVYAQGEVDAKMAQLLSQLGLQKEQFVFMNKNALQQKRGEDQLRKAVATKEVAHRIKMQEPLI